ncbi:MAG: hypothetical protein AVDCRST_MAG49-77 [uncultured Thermomicrobiales bacterium]|uniref:Uncharacterized protein n=1 Tax=uncultured Thermomicrobiales bacterium TaxID=1645740 RepID=A0A6J4TW82_9BACT|nr:MAG: hypothetical protein AVDCRST_MAG49-77 [uncultured Thermomicrobiales bacterium]
MDASRFDALTRTFAARRSRRAALRGGAGLGAAALAAHLGRAAAQDATPVGTPEPEMGPGAAPDPATLGEDGTFLFVQTATSGSFAPNPNAGTPAAGGEAAPGGGAEYLLTLKGHPGGTVFFSDRPQRIFGEAPTEQFLAGLGFQPDNPPNAALVAQTEDGDDVVVLELLTPTYDADAGTLIYGATILAEYEGEGLSHVAEQQMDEALPEAFGRASLFIDDCPDLEACYITDVSVSTEGPGVGLRKVGVVPDGPVGTCWSWSAFACHPCDGESLYDIGQRCNETYAECADSCFVYAPGLS